MTKIKDSQLIKLHLLARDVSEAAMVCGYTSPAASTYEDRFLRVEQALDALLKEVAGEDKNG